MFVDDNEQADGPSVVGPRQDEVVRPNMVWCLRPQADTAAVIEPETASLGLSYRHCQPIARQLGRAIRPCNGGGQQTAEGRRQMRSTRLAFTVQPAWRSSAVTRR